MVGGGGGWGGGGGGAVTGGCGGVCGRLSVECAATACGGVLNLLAFTPIYLLCFTPIYLLCLLVQKVPILALVC
jgi:hypothetical protein